MKSSIHYRFIVGVRNIFVILGIVIFYSCGSPPVNEATTENPDDEQVEVPFEESPVDEAWADEEEPGGAVGGVKPEKVVKPPSAGSGAPIGSKDSIVDSVISPELTDYSVILDVQKVIKSQSTGEFYVWIGAEKFVPRMREDVARDSSTIPQNIGQFAKITPYAPDFTFEPAESKCIRITPTGTMARFTLKPIKQGTFKVSAIVELYENASCSGPAIPMSVKTLSVMVEVDYMTLFTDKSEELLSVLWTNFLTFWGALIALLFAAGLFVIRRKLKKKTGFDGN